MRILNILILILLIKTTSAQETLLPIGSKTSTGNSTVDLKSSVRQPSINIPFLNDFSENTETPNTQFWQADTMVQISNNLGFQPPSIGVAVLDAMSTGGNHYNSNHNLPFVADILTSNPIDLSKIEPGKAKFFFHYQPQGFGSDAAAPDKHDTLYVMFSGNGTNWDTAWSTSGQTLAEFHKTQFNLDDLSKDTTYFKEISLSLDSVDYLTSEFQFRFVTKASLGSSATDQSAEYVNDDFWLIDYVYLDTVDAIPNDLAYSEAPSSIFKKYETVPYKHYSEAISKERGRYSYSLYNRGVRQEWPMALYFYSEDLQTEIDAISLKESDIDGYTYKSSTTNLEKGELSLLDNYITSFYKPVSFYVVNDMVRNEPNDFEGNNTVYYKQELSDYYAYDDGSAEAAYGSTKSEIQGTTIAMKFHTYLTDTLTGFRINFQKNNPEDDAATVFTLIIWDDNDGEMGDILLEQPGVGIEYGNSINHFADIKLETPIEVSGNFYIGILHVQDRRINIGFDKHNFNQDKVQFTRENEWYSSQIPGTLMIRPVFGQTTQAQPAIAQNLSWKCYPNPVSSPTITLEGELFEQTEGTIEILNHMGLNYYRGNFNETQINVSDFPQGVYFIRCYPETGEPSSKKIIITGQL